MFRTSPDKSRKLESIARDDIPTKLEIQRHLGISLAQVLFDYGHREAAELLNAVSRRQESSYCTTPDCRSKRPPRTWSEEQGILKSHIHHEILTLGEDALRKYQAEIEASTRDKLKDELSEKTHTLEAEKRITVRRNQEEIHAMYEEYLIAAQRELEQRLQADWEDARARHNRELQRAVVKTRLDTTHDVLRRIRPRVCYIVATLHNDCKRSLCAQRERMIADFNKIVRKQHVNLEARVREVEREKMQELLSQRHELEIRNATDIIYVLCMERLRNSSQVHAIHKEFEEKRNFLRDVIVKQNEIASEMRNKIAEYQRRNATLEERLSAMTNEFQKFINFALDAVPEHADYLLPLDLLFAGDTSKEGNAEQQENR